MNNTLPSWLLSIYYWFGLPINATGIIAACFAKHPPSDCLYRFSSSCASVKHPMQLTAENCHSNESEVRKRGREYTPTSQVSSVVVAAYLWDTSLASRPAIHRQPVIIAYAETVA